MGFFTHLLCVKGRGNVSRIIETFRPPNSGVSSPNTAGGR